ncbi:Clarin-3-like [Homarus americanus]|uniref:Clarin-3-like n=1 Tax=Homarus americanus TaxID=6706 RepID=A0A8J5N1J1_HOMAM|nr:Clarin-3-like [Homarus americanus]
MLRNKQRVRKRSIIFGTFFVCCLGASLVASSMATQNWFESGCSANATLSLSSHGNVNFGLFSGKIYTNHIITKTTRLVKVVCLDGKCMYSCGKTKALRQEQLRQVMNGTPKNFSITDNCQREDDTKSSSSSHRFFLPRLIQDSPGGGDIARSLFFPLFAPESADPRLGAGLWGAPLKVALETDTGEVEVADSSLSKTDNEEVEEEEEEEEAAAAAEAAAAEEEAAAAAAEEEAAAAEADLDHAEFMDYGLWVGTVACLGLGMVFAVVGALFAVINTATTPVEAITGVPGLYLWNALAALFNLICVILWAVQFHKHLTNNVLLYDAADGWTTAGQESFGYSYWLVVVAIFVHVVNIGIIYMGTYDPKVKEQLQAPDPKGGNIMLY